MNGQVKVTLKTLRTIAQYLMVNARVSEEYIHFLFMYTTYHIFPVLPIKYLINKDSNTTTPFKLAASKKPLVSHLRVLFCPCVLRKATAHVDKKALNMRHQAQTGFLRYLCWNPTALKGYLVYIPNTRKIISSYVVVFYEFFSSALAYTSQLYSEATYMRPSITHLVLNLRGNKQAI